MYAELIYYGIIMVALGMALLMVLSANGDDQ